MHSRFNAPGVNYRLGNPLLGMSLGELFASSGDEGRTGFFSEDSGDVMSRLKEMHRLHATLSDRIKEDALVKNEIEATLGVYRQRIGEIMDLMTASCFEEALEMEKISELLYHIDGDEEIWQAARAEKWYVSAREMAGKKHFFHMEVEFPFLLNDGFDAVFIQPALNYLWDERVPAGEITKAYIKRAMAYLKQTGVIVLMGAGLDELVPELRKSKRYAVDARGRAVMVRRC
jgi:predicted XRE-type DNA-binding protein